jgi:hypothetical protein
MPLRMNTPAVLVEDGLPSTRASNRPLDAAAPKG